MYSEGDLVQPKQGGPKMKVISVDDAHVITVIASDEGGKKYTLKLDEVTPYHEEGDFGVC